MAGFEDQELFVDASDKKKSELSVVVTLKKKSEAPKTGSGRKGKASKSGDK